MKTNGSCPASPLPSFRKPPVIETVLGVQFAPLDGLTSGHLGKFWAILDDWSRCIEANPIGQATEQFGGQALWGPHRFRLMQQMGVRLQIRRSSEDRLLQIENGWFTLNWRKIEGSAQYPRYGVLVGEFFSLWERFQSFLNQAGFGTPTPTLWEVTYVNHIPKGPLWNSPEDWVGIVPGQIGQTPRVDRCHMETANCVRVFELGAQEGRLRVWLEHAKTSATEEVLVLKLSSRGAIQSEDPAILRKGFELGRSSVVSMFAAVTSEKAHQHWERES